MYYLWMLAIYFLEGHGTYLFKLKGKKLTLTPLAPNQIPKTETGREKHKKSSLLVNGGRVERVISKGKPIYLPLWWNISLTQIPQPFTPQSSPCYKSLRMFFLKTYPWPSS